MYGGDLSDFSQQLFWKSCTSEQTKVFFRIFFFNFTTQNHFNPNFHLNFHKKAMKNSDPELHKIRESGGTFY